jgi:DNA repair protein RecO (recombination protein O)
MSMEKVHALVLRTTDFSETSRIATLWTRELGKVRALAKGGRRLRSNFENALDLLTECRIVLLRKSSGGLDLLTEAQVVRRFPALRGDLQALYAGYYVAELMSDAFEENDPHPVLFDEALATLEVLGTPEAGPVRVVRFELVLLRELGWAPSLESCAGCGAAVTAATAFSAAAGGVVCVRCQPAQRDRRRLSNAAWLALRELGESGEAWRRAWAPDVCAELRQLLGQYVTYLLGRRPRLLSYLGS